MAESWTEVRNTQDDPGTSCSTTKVLKKKKMRDISKGIKSQLKNLPMSEAGEKFPVDQTRK